MEAYGSDRVRVAADGRIALLSKVTKGWTPRTVKTLTSAEFPGTAVLWSEAYYEVVDAQPVAAGGVRYLLLPWRDEHAMRVVDRYDAESEVLRVEEHRKAVRRERGRFGANLLGILTGHLPAAVQEGLGSELGIAPARLTMLSTLLPYAFVIAVTFVLVDNLMKERTTPLPLLLAAAFFLIETNIRVFMVLSQNRPLGSTLGLFTYMIFYALTPNRAKLVSPFHVEKGLSSRALGVAPDDVLLRDAFILREPLITLLSPGEQAVAAERFGYDYRKHSYKLAAVILVFAICGVATSVSSHAVLSGLTALALSVEQVVRLFALRRGPAPSILGWVVRPLVRKLLV